MDRFLWEAILSHAQRVYRESLEAGIRPIEMEDAVVLYSTAFLVARRGGSVAVDAGAGIGFSTLWIALGLDSGCVYKCELHAIEHLRERGERIPGNLGKLGLARTTLKVTIDDALKVLEGFRDGSLSYVFVDIEKDRYPHVMNLLSRKLSRRGIALFHNAFYPPPPAVFFEEASKPPWASTIIPTRAGILVAVKEG